MRVKTLSPASCWTYLYPGWMLSGLWRQRELIWQLAKRDVQGRYRATYLGLVWSILTPLLLLVVYTFVFSVVFHSRWQDKMPESRTQFALTMFCGMMLFTLFSEVVNRAPGMIVSNANYVKKVVFPLEVFVISGLLSSLFNLLISMLVWMVAMLLFQGHLPWTILLLPVALLPVCLLTVGIGWFLSSLGVFVRDIGPLVLLVTQVLFLITPIFYNIERVPPPYRGILEINPLTHSVDDARRVMIMSQLPNWQWWVPTFGVSVILALLGYAFFMKSKGAFADVI